MRDHITNGNEILQEFGTTIFATMSALAAQHGAVNLGQGFPDGNGPDDVRQVAARALLDGPNQYPPMRGVPELRRAVADGNRRFYGLDIDPQDGVLVTSGATEALTAAILGLVNPGDEAVVIEPVYDSYLPILRLAGADVRSVRLLPPAAETGAWTLPDNFESAFTSRTKLLILNSPMNPIGKVFDEAELARIAAALRGCDAVALCDEVYEHLVFDGARHVPLMTLPGMADRCLRVGSAGKTFSLTGWKVGYLSGSPMLVDAAARAHQFLTFTTPPNLQQAVAYGLAKDDQYFADLKNDLQEKRDFLAAQARLAGLRVLPSQGTYFIVCDYRALSSLPALEFCRQMVIEAGVAAIPLAAFYADGQEDRLIRLCFCKSAETLAEGGRRLRMYGRRGA